MRPYDPTAYPAIVALLSLCSAEELQLLKATDIPAAWRRIRQVTVYQGEGQR